MGVCWGQTETCEVRIEDFSVNAIYFMLQYMYGVLHEMPSMHSQVTRQLSQHVSGCQTCNAFLVSQSPGISSFLSWRGSAVTEGCRWKGLELDNSLSPVYVSDDIEVLCCCDPHSL